MTPEETLSSLQKDSSKRVQDTLNAIYKICMEQKERGINDFSYTSIARLGAGHNVPKAQSIRNASGEKYRALIQAFADDSSNLPNSKSISKRELDWIEEIKDPKQKLLTKIMASQLKEAKSIVDEMLPPSQRIDIYDHKNISNDQKNKNYKLTNQESRAFTYLLSDGFLKKWNFKATEYGEIVDTKNNVVFKAGTIDALRKALTFLT